MRKIIYLVVLVIALLASLQIKSWVDSSITSSSTPVVENPSTNNPPSQGGVVSATTTLNGSFTCLPHAGNPEVITLECAFGFKASDGSHYALDWQDSATSAFDLPMDRMYSITGLMTPIEMISSDNWQKYDVKGIVKVYSYEEITKDIPVQSAGQLLTLELKKPVIVGDYKITIGAVLEDSRCPADAMCIQQGRARVAVSAENESDSIAEVLEINQAMPLGSQTLTLVSVDPYPLASKKTLDSEYRFGIIVK